MLRFLALLALGGVGMLAARAQVAMMHAPPRTISVTAMAEQQASPDLALVTLAVQTQASTLGRAVEQNNQFANRVLAAVRRLNIPNLTMRTLDYDVQPLYEQPAPSTTLSLIHILTLPTTPYV